MKTLTRWDNQLHSSNNHTYPQTDSRSTRDKDQLNSGRRASRQQDKMAVEEQQRTTLSPPTKASRVRASARNDSWFSVALLVQSLAVLVVAIMLLKPNDVVEANPVATTDNQNYGNLENLISDFLDDAGDRLKKSKLNGLRQVKQTLRFGRRSDPSWLVPNYAQMSPEELVANRQRLLELME